MNRSFRIIFFSVILFTVQIQAQFKFSGEVNQAFIHSKAYLVAIDNYKQSDLFLTNQILQETAIDIDGYFEFTGDFLSETNKIYKLYIDQCNDEITNASHLLEKCDKSTAIVFIANGTDTVHFALNSLNQMFCSFKNSSPENLAIHKIDSVQEVLLSKLQNTKSDAQRNILFKTYFKELQSYSLTLNEPLAELYSYNLYANKKSFTRELYNNDLKSSNYYVALLNRLKTSYPNTSYTSEYEDDLNHDNVNPKKDTFSILILCLIILLLISLSLNFSFIRKKKIKLSRLDYKEALSTQEQNVFELMHKGLSNKEIAGQLFVSLSTIKSHINHIYSKLNIRSRKEISSYFL